MAEQHRCRRGDRCAAWEQHPTIPGGRIGARINPADGLCETCTRHLARALAALPRDYVDLHGCLARGGGGTREYVRDTPEGPIPIRVDVDALHTDMVHEATCWAESTAEVLGIFWDTQRARDARPGYTLQRACELLGNALSVLLALRDVDHTGWVHDTWTVRTRDGLDAAGRFIDMHRLARAFTGQLRMTNQLPAPCPRCHTVALERPDGSESVDCAACGRRYTWDEYETLCTLQVRRYAA